MSWQSQGVAPARPANAMSPARWAALFVFVVGACSGATPLSLDVPPADGVRPTPAETGGDTRGGYVAGTAVVGSGGGSATVTVGSESYHLATDSADQCSIEFGVQASMHSADRRAGLDVFTTRVTVGAFIFSRVLDGEVWQPSDQPPAPFEISAPRATWTGPMRERDSGREEQVTVDITCGG
jgi:hypothetical protein